MQFKFSRFSVFIAIFQVLQCVFLIVHDFQFSCHIPCPIVCNSHFFNFSMLLAIFHFLQCFSFSMIFSFLAIFHVLQCLFLFFHDFLCFSKCFTSYSESFSFSTIFSFLTIFHILPCAFHIFQLF